MNLILWLPLWPVWPLRVLGLELILWGRDAPWVGLWIGGGRLLEVIVARCGISAWVTTYEEMEDG